MAWPPDPVAADKTNDTVVTDDHAPHHNELANAINDTVTELVAHEADISAAHAASAISVDSTTLVGTGTDVQAVFEELDDSLATKLSALTPWTSAINAASYNLDSVGAAGIGAASTTTSKLIIGGSETNSSSTQTRYGINLSNSLTLSGAGTHNVRGVSAAPTFVANTTVADFNGLYFLPAISGSGTITNANAVNASAVPTTTVTNLTGVNATVGAGLGGTITTLIGIKSAISGFGTTTTAVVFDGSVAAGTPTTTIGLRLTTLAGTTTWAMQVGDYQSYHHGKLTLGATTAPTYALDIKGTAQDRGVIALTETATPTNPSQSNQVLVYAKSDAIVFAFNDAGTMRYKSLTLSGTGVTWAHSTTAP